MNKININLDFSLDMNQVKNMILFMLIDDNSYPHKIDKERVLLKLKQFLVCYGINFLTEENIKNKFSYLKNLEDFENKSKFLVYELFPELSDEENTIKFIKSIGD
jgi:hypothetical protein